MKYEVAMTAGVNECASTHLLHHYHQGGLQEDLCFALWRPSTGSGRITGLVYEILLPEAGDRLLHGNASFQPSYIARAIRRAVGDEAGLAFMHSHPGKGWQGMSPTDIVAERRCLSVSRRSHRYPVVGIDHRCRWLLECQVLGKTQRGDGAERLWESSGGRAG